MVYYLNDICRVCYHQPQTMMTLYKNNCEKIKYYYLYLPITVRIKFTD